MQKPDILRDNESFINLVLVLLLALFLLSIPAIIDYYIINNTEGNTRIYGKDIVTPNRNYIVEGRYNYSVLDVEGYSIKIDRQLNNSWLYKECSHITGDEVKYYGVFYQPYSPAMLYNISDNIMIFAIKRELC